MKALLLIFTFILLLHATKAQHAEVKTNPDQIEKSYQETKNEFEKFENTHGNFIQTKNVKMHYLAWGNPSNPALIWAHGSFLNAYELFPVADNLAKAGFYIIAIDYYGHGLTEIPDHEVSLYHVADDIKLLMEKLGIKKAFIGGFSRGGYISTAFYDAYPKNVLGLILEDGGSVNSNAYYDKLSTEELNDKAKEFDVKTHNPWDTTYNSEAEAFKSIYDPNEKESQINLFAIIRKNKSGKWSFYPGLPELFHLKNSQEFLDLTLRSAKVPLFAESMVIMEPKIIFRNLNVPVLIMDPVSKNDPFPVEKENQALQQQHPKFIQQLIYPDIEHNILYANPNKFTKDVIAFLKKVKKLDIKQ